MKKEFQIEVKIIVYKTVTIMAENYEQAIIEAEEEVKEKLRLDICADSYKIDYSF